MSDLGDWVEFWFSGSGIFDFDGNFGFWGPRYRTEILKLKELPNDGFETSRGALWLGMAAFFAFRMDFSTPEIRKN